MPSYPEFESTSKLLVHRAYSKHSLPNVRQASVYDEDSVRIACSGSAELAGDEFHRCDRRCRSIISSTPNALRRTEFSSTRGKRQATHYFRSSMVRRELPTRAASSAGWTSRLISGKPRRERSRVFRRSYDRHCSEACSSRSRRYPCQSRLMPARKRPSFRRPDNLRLVRTIRLHA